MKPSLVGPALPCAQATAGNNPFLFLRAFRSARIAGQGAEECLSSDALATYRSFDCKEADLQAVPGPICLYRYGVHAVTDIRLAGRISAEEDGMWFVPIEVELDGSEMRFVETLGISKSGGRQLITEVSNT